MVTATSDTLKTWGVHSLTHALTRSLAHALTHSRTHSLTHLRTHALTRSKTHSLTHALTHAYTHNLQGRGGAGRARTRTHVPSDASDLVMGELV